MNKSISVLLMCVISHPAFAGLSAYEIMNRHEDARKLDDVQSSAILKTGGGGSPDRTKEFTWWRKLNSDRVHYNTLTRFHRPPEIRGEGILFLEGAQDENEVLMYLPNFKKIRRVESQQQSGSFMGSEFSYSDIATPHVDDYKHKLVRGENCPGADSATKCFVIESIPATDSVRERTGYSKTMNWIRQDNFMSVHGEYFNDEGNLIKKLDASEIKMEDPVKKKWMARKVRIESAKTGRFTVLEFSAVKANHGIPDSTFTQQNLSRAQ